MSGTQKTAFFAETASRPAPPIPPKKQNHGSKRIMKLSRNFTMIAGASLLFVAGALAKPANSDSWNKGNLELGHNVTVQGKELPAGNYKIEWTGNGPDVNINITQGRKTVMTVPARVVQEQVANDNDAYISKNHKDGSKTLDQILFAGKHFELDIDNGTSSAD
jgi:hypothetical protein